MIVQRFLNRLIQKRAGRLPVFALIIGDELSDDVMFEVSVNLWQCVNLCQCVSVSVCVCVYLCAYWFVCRCVYICVSVC